MIKKGFYIKKTAYSQICSFITGKKYGNKFIELKLMNRGFLIKNDNATWKDLNWACINVKELESCEYHETNPTEFIKP